MGNNIQFYLYFFFFFFAYSALCRWHLELYNLIESQEKEKQFPRRWNWYFILHFFLFLLTLRNDLFHENILGQASVSDPPLVSARFVLNRGAKKKKRFVADRFVLRTVKEKIDFLLLFQKKNKKKKESISSYYFSSNRNSFSRSNSFVSNCT